MSEKNLKLNVSEKFNVYIVEDHNDVLEYIYKEIGTKRIKFSDLTMIHFDSHPDLSLPDINADHVFLKQKLFDNLSIENWICPSVYAGHLANLVWIKPFWSKQIECGIYKINIGKDTKSGMIRCDSRLEYFTSGNMYSPAQDLVNLKTLNLYVCEFEQILCSKDEFLVNLITKSDRKNLILDIDLDFFSTQNPFLQMFKNIEDYTVFKNVYLNEQLDKLDPDFDSKFNENNFKREKKMDKIKKFILDESTISTKDMVHLKEIIYRDKIDFEILHLYGSGIDSADLPHHVSSNIELEDFFNKFENFLNIYFEDSCPGPGLITIARSSLDDYCPISQVNLIQDRTLGILGKLFKNFINKINYVY
ncbi:hypothetical protein BpHYR1_004267 [Brachionus plicatilis]|uniref:Uncharacterized protein n=1 Tax=Brachionus plicatilis TaxID=10195 RepID=A0A3M7QPI9_BRAPC|nr:hypothetical protein BpHYR1_004267 [Brachionus plicatilis]